MKSVQKTFQIFSLLVLVLLTACQPLAEADIQPNPASTPAEVSLEVASEMPTLKPSPAPTVTPMPSDDDNETIVIAFTGVIVPARCVQASIDERGGDASYLYANVKEILAGADITVGVYNATMSAAVEHVGCENTWELVGSPENADALSGAGFDVMSVATNHIKDCGKKYCGDTAFFDTLSHLERVGIQAVGAGNNLSAALQPVYVEVRGIRFGFVSLGEVNERVFAGIRSPGIANLTRDNLELAISMAADNSDFVIVLPHSGPEDYPEVTAQQYYWARHSVAFGADLVVTNHAHVLQGHEEINGVLVFYSLGNFVFDQSVERGLSKDHQQGAILLVEFDGEEILGFELTPTIVDLNGTVNLAEGEEREEILARVHELSTALEDRD